MKMLKPILATILFVVTFLSICSQEYKNPNPQQQFSAEQYESVSNNLIKMIRYTTEEKQKATNQMELNSKDQASKEP